MSESTLEYDDDPADERPEKRAAVDADDAGLPIRQGIVFGAAAVLVTYLTHLYLAAVAAAQTTPITYTEDGSTVVTDLVATWTAAGWSYLGAFGVGFEVDGESVALSGAANSVDPLTDAPFAFADTVLFAVTVGTVVLAGYGVVRYTGADDAVQAVKASVTVVPAFLVFAAVVAFLMTHTYTDAGGAGTLVENVAVLEGDQFFGEEGNLATEPEFAASVTDALLFAGIVFPAIFAILGGLAAQWRDALDAAVAQVEQRT